MRNEYFSHVHLGHEQGDITRQDVIGFELNVNMLISTVLISLPAGNGSVLTRQHFPAESQSPWEPADQGGAHHMPVSTLCI